MRHPHACSNHPTARKHGSARGPDGRQSQVFTRQCHTPQEVYPQAAEFLANYHRARAILEEICAINRELLRRREAL